LVAQKAAADVVISRFDTADDVSKFRFDFGSVPHTESFDPTVDADMNSKSGSMKISLDFNSDMYGNDNKAAYTHDFFPGIDATKYDGFAMDVMVDPNSANDAFGQNGYFNAALRNGSNYDYQSQPGMNLNSTAGWQHYEVTPLTGTVDDVRGLTLQLYGGPQQNITGNVTLWIDNIVFEQAQNQIPGDANGDGKVNFADLLILAQNYGKTSGAMFSTGDFNNDGGVGFDDLLILAQHYGFGTGAQAVAVPEPSSAALLLVGGAVLLRRRRSGEAV
jgi:hypothetical protein